MTLLILMQLIVVSALTGLVLLVQLTHYPSFRFVSDDQWNNFHAHHSRSISVIVMPLMLAELGMSLYWVWLTPKVVPLVCLGLVGVVWLNTFLQAVPLHGQLGAAKDEAKINKLVRVNIIRTISWFVRTMILGYVVFEMM